MYIFVTSVYPNEKAKEVADMYLKAVTKYPDNNSVSTPIVPVAAHMTRQGQTVTVIYEPKKGKLEEAYALVVNRMVMFHDIKGFESTHEIHYNLEEGMKVLGM